jgi:hypothetical protein
MRDPQTHEPETCSHGLTRGEGCTKCEALTVDEDGEFVASPFERLAIELERAGEALAMIRDYPLASGLF